MKRVPAFTFSPPVVACIDPDPQVFEAFVETHRARVFRFAAACLRDRDAAEAITQDCFFKAHRAWGSFRHDCSFETWIMKIALNLIRDHTRNRRLQFWRHARERSSWPEPTSNLRDSRSRSPESQMLLKERVAAVWAAAAALPAKQRTVFILRFADEMDVLEIAATAGMKEGTVKVHLFRALQTLRKGMLT